MISRTDDRRGIRLQLGEFDSDHYVVAALTLHWLRPRLVRVRMMRCRCFQFVIGPILFMRLTSN